MKSLLFPLSWPGYGLLMLAVMPMPAGAAEDRAFECRNTFPADLDQSALVARYGAANVREESLPLGEGFEEAGTVLFPDAPEDRVEILWLDQAAKSRPNQIRARGQRSNWADPNGLTIGSELLGIERINGKPFRLAGFGWDYGGTQTSWAGGLLESPADASCNFRVLLRAETFTAERRALENQVQGDRDFSSGHPAMQALNPRVYEIWLMYKRPPVPARGALSPP